ncbi:MAG TPA: putative zinc-binding metallopeptidase, partial [Spongiibacteraceae bacterium]|nr:putative zinc-binding metallopeptidase [Spongiibacteraceae bacterium]
LPQNTFYWRKLEAAKRYAIYTLLKLNLPFGDEAGADIPALLFRFMSDKDASSEFTQPLEGLSPVYTGHEQGAITINLAEADDIARTRARIELGEGYRTLLGHFRHELGHYYWSVLVESQPHLLQEFRAIFGDEQQDYAAALQRYYATDRAVGWQNEYLSAYATMHPWEDWAECWAHYMHMIDTLETANAFALSLDNEPLASVLSTSKNKRKAIDTDKLLKNWMRLAVAMNALNRSMGLEDVYPFILTDPIRRKLNWISKLIVDYRPAARTVRSVASRASSATAKL